MNKIADLGSCTRWVIVKYYLSTPTDLSHIEKIFDHFQVPLKAWMTPADVRPQNYKSQYFLDVGKTITFPHSKWNRNLFHWFYANLQSTVHYVRDWEYRNGILEIGAL